MVRSRFLAATALCAMLITACSGGGAGALNVSLATLNASGITGTAVMTDLGNGKTKVEVSTNVANGNNNMAAHVHPGTCATLDPKPIYPLNNVQEGKSTTEIAVKLADIRTGAFAVNLHTTADAKIYAACGDIPKA